MSKTYDQLVTDISLATDAVFGNQRFTPFDPEPSDHIPQTMSALERTLVFEDAATDDILHVSEQYVFLQKPDSVPLKRRYLEVTWGSLDFVVKMELDEGGLDINRDKLIQQEGALWTAQQILRLLNVVQYATWSEAYALDEGLRLFRASAGTRAA